jgi:hypothetical protein
MSSSTAEYIRFGDKPILLPQLPLTAEYLKEFRGQKSIGNSVDRALSSNSLVYKGIDRLVQKATFNFKNGNARRIAFDLQNFTLDSVSNEPVTEMMVIQKLFDELWKAASSTAGIELLSAILDLPPGKIDKTNFFQYLRTYGECWQEALTIAMVQKAYPGTRFLTTPKVDTMTSIAQIKSYSSENPASDTATAWNTVKKQLQDQEIRYCEIEGAAYLLAASQEARMSSSLPEDPLADASASPFSQSSSSTLQPSAPALESFSPSSPRQSFFSQPSSSTMLSPIDSQHTHSRKPLHMIFIVDVSGTMRKAIPQLKAALQSIVDDERYAGNKISVIKFATKAFVVSDVVTLPDSNIVDGINREIETPTMDNSSNILGGFLQLRALSEITDPAFDTHIVLVTDGQDDRNTKKRNETERLFDKDPAVREKYAEQILQLTQEGNGQTIPIHTIGMTTNADQQLLKILSSKSQAVESFIVNEADIKIAVDDLARHLHMDERAPVARSKSPTRSNR